MILDVRDVWGGYGEVDILTGVSLTVDEGEIVTVAGTNGAGKSTLARAVVGLLPRVRGRILFAGDEITALSPEARFRRGIGYVPQVANVFPSLTVQENLALVAGIVGRKDRIEVMFDAFPRLGERRRQRASSLSGGERQQLAFARALVPEPRLMVLDEPTAALAPNRVSESFERIADLPRLGVSVLIIEQRARQSLAVSQRGFIMDGGKVALSGPAPALLADSRAADLYLGKHTA